MAINKKLIDNKYLILFLIFLFLLKILMLVSIESSGYSVDIYQQMGPLIIILSIIIFLFGIILSYLTRNIRYQSIIFLILLLNMITVIITPKLLDYYIADRGDSLNSIGYEKPIVSYGHIEKTDFYPFLFIHLAIIDIISGIDFFNIIWLEIITINFIFIAGLYLFIKKYYKNSPNYLVLFLCFTPWLGIYHEYLIAHFFAYSVVFIWLIVLIKILNKSNSQTYFVFIFLSLLLIFSHPFAGIYALIVFSIWILWIYYSNREIKKYINLLLVLIIITGAWIIYNYILLRSLVSYPSYLHELFIFNQMEYSLEAVKLPISIVIQSIIVRFLPNIILIALLFLLGIIPIFFEKNSFKSIFNDISIILILSGIFYSFFLLLIKHGYDRIIGLNFIFFGQIALIANLYNIPLKKEKTQRIKKYLMIIIIFLASLSFFSVFLSPINGFPFQGITKSEVKATSFSFDIISNSDKLIDPTGESKRWSVWHYGVLKSIEQNKILYLHRLPDHFGYSDDTKFFSENKFIWKIEYNVFGKFEKQEYNYRKLLVAIPKAQIEWYEKVPTYNTINRFNYQDLNRLKSDKSVSNIYTNNNFLLFKIL